MIIYSVALLWGKWITSLQDGSAHIKEKTALDAVLRSSRSMLISPGEKSTTNTEFVPDGDIEADRSLPPMLRRSAASERAVYGGEHRLPVLAQEAIFCS
ncbi:hypothetical protein R1flu_011760 [Riccia fluitans]|uniref:Uncharacterized protein n=1 Tax=Riccia fluitans TaxID=41844 RepID=A0ABD1Z8P6_9MARC